MMRNSEMALFGQNIYPHSKSLVTLIKSVADCYGYFCSKIASLSEHENIFIAIEERRNETRTKEKRKF